MQIRQNISPAILTAAVGMLQPFIPELSPQNLITALKNHNAKKSSADETEKPLTREEAAEMLSVSLNTVTRYMNIGILRRINMGPRLVRIDRQSVRNLLNQPEA